MSKFDTVVIGSGPNGLIASIILQNHGLKVLLLEASDTVGGGMRTKCITEDGFYHDICSAVHALGSSSPIFSKLPLENRGLEWLYFPVECAQPIDGSDGVGLFRSLEETLAQFSDKGKSTYQNLLDPLLKADKSFFTDILAPVPFKVPKNPLQLLRFGMRSIWPSDLLVKITEDQKMKALLSGMVGHSILPFDKWMTSAIGLILCFSGHSLGWPIAKGGSGNIAKALESLFIELGGTIRTDSKVSDMSQLEDAKSYVFATSPRVIAEVFKDKLPPSYKKRLLNFKYGSGVYKIDWALSNPIPFLNSQCRKAGTVHIGGTYEEVAFAEKQVSLGKIPEKPFVLLSQPTLIDKTRAPEGKHIAWGYCHVPANCEENLTEKIENQIERFAPGFKDTILKRHIMTPKDMETYNGNYIGGDITGGIQDMIQQFRRPVFSPDPYQTPLKNVYLASSSTPPGAGVHGMCGYYAAKSLLKKVFSIELDAKYKI